MFLVSDPLATIIGSRKSVEGSKFLVDVFQKPKLNKQVMLAFASIFVIFFIVYSVFTERQNMLTYNKQSNVAGSKKPTNFCKIFYWFVWLALFRKVETWIFSLLAIYSEHVFLMRMILWMVCLYFFFSWVMSSWILW